MKLFQDEDSPMDNPSYTLETNLGKVIQRFPSKEKLLEAYVRQDLALIAFKEALIKAEVL